MNEKPFECRFRNMSIVEDNRSKPSRSVQKHNFPTLDPLPTVTKDNFNLSIVFYPDVLTASRTDTRPNMVFVNIVFFPLTSALTQQKRSM